MSEYYPGYIFHDGEDYPEVAAWCNANGCYIKEITPDAEGRRFEIVKIPPKSLDEAKADKIAELNAAKNHQLDTGGLESAPSIIPGISAITNELIPSALTTPKFGFKVVK